MKTNHTSLLKYFSFIVSFIFVFEAHANLPGAQSNYTLKEDYESSLPNPRNSTNQNGVRGCGDINSLTFVGLKFIGQATCIAASDDARADVLCNSGRHVNPGNPQYGGSDSLTRNSLGYYYCISDDPRNQKAIMCQNLARLYHPYLNFEFRRVGGDGNCYCGYNGQMQECNNVQQISDTAKASACADAQNPNVVNRAYTAEQAANEMMNGQGTGNGFSVDRLFCKCNQNAPERERNAFFTAPATATSCGYSGPTVAAAAATSATTTVTPTQQQEFDRCLADYRQRAMDCQSQANTARDTCRDKMKEAQNSPLNIAGNMVGALGQVGIAANAGSGNQQNCFGAGVGMMGVREALKLGKESCQSEFGTCENTCKQENFDRMQTECPSKFRDPATNQPLTQAQLIQRGDENARKFQENREEFQRLANEGRRICQSDAGGANEDMSRLMNGLGRSIQGSMQCACNLSSQNNASTNCNQIPTIQSCETNPTLPNCQIYGGLETCNPGSAGYNQQQCNCMQNPSGCTTVSGTPPPSMFGGNLNNPLAPSGFAGNLGGGSAGGGGGGRSGYDLGSDGGGEGQAMLARPEFGAGARGGAGGGGMGGMGGGSGAAGGPAADGVAKVEEGGKGLSGLFNQARTAIAGALGFGKGGAAASKGSSAGKPGGKDDLTKFKPRGLASAGRNGIGSANMDIFGMIKMCAQGETCETNRPKSAWILTP